MLVSNARWEANTRTSTVRSSIDRPISFGGGFFLWSAEGKTGRETWRSRLGPGFLLHLILSLPRVQLPKQVPGSCSAPEARTGSERPEEARKVSLFSPRCPFRPFSKNGFGTLFYVVLLGIFPMVSRLSLFSGHTLLRFFQKLQRFPVLSLVREHSGEGLASRGVSSITLKA